MQRVVGFSYIYNWENKRERQENNELIFMVYKQDDCEIGTCEEEPQIDRLISIIDGWIDRRMN